MTDYSTLTKDTLEYTRDKLRNDTNLCVTILGFSGTTEAINRFFVKRPAREKLNSSGEPTFKIPRIVLDLIDSSRGKMGNNQDGLNASGVDFQVSFWVDDNPWSLSLDTADRIANLLEDDNMPVTNGWSKFELISSSDIQDPDRRQTRMGTIIIKTTIEGG